MSRRLSLAVVVAVLLLTMAGCSSDSSVGGGIDAGKLKGGGGTRLGEVTSTSTPPVTVAPATTKPTTAVKTTTTVAQAVALEIKIQGAAPQFNPSVGSVRSGSLVRWINADTQARSVEADGGAFVSPSIPPGGHFDLKAPAAGTYNYHDGTRPYAVAQLQVS